MAAGEGSGAAGVIVGQGGRPLEQQVHNTAQKPPPPWIYISCHPCTVLKSSEDTDRDSKLRENENANADSLHHRNHSTRTPTLEANIGYTTNQPAEIHEWHETGVGTRYNISFGLYTYESTAPDGAAKCLRRYWS